MAEVATCGAVPSIRSSFDMGWGGVSRSQLRSTIVSTELDRMARRSMQLDQEISMQLSCPLQDTPFSKGEQLLPADQGELTQLQQALLLQQAQQQAHLANESTQSADELGIDAQITRLLQLKQYLRFTKQTGAQQQQHPQSILEDSALAPDVNDTLDVTASGLFASSGLCTPMPSESLLSPTPDLRSNSWSNLAACRAAAQPSRRSVDMGGLAQQLAALEMSNNAAAAALAEAQALGDMAAGLRPNNRLSLDCGGGLANLASEELVAAAAMAAAAQAQAEAASRRTSLCVGGPQMSGLLDDMAVLNSLNQLQAQSQLQAAAARQSMDLASASAARQSMDLAALAMQSSLYAPATPAMDAQLQAAVTTASMVGLNMPSPAALAVAAQMSPARHSLDCSLLGAAGLPPAALGGMGGLQSPAGVHAPAAMHSPVCGRASMNLSHTPLLADRGLAMAQAHAQQAQSDAAGWGFSSRRAAGRGRASVDNFGRASSDLPRSHTPEHHVPPRKSISMITPGSGASSSASSSSSGRGSPRGSSRQGLAASHRMSMDSRPPMHPPHVPLKKSPSSTNLVPKAPEVHAAAPAPAAAAAGAARKGTGVFIPACMLKSSSS